VPQSAPFEMTPIATDALKGHYDFIVVGSGYGGSVAALRLAEAGRDVCVLERGRELLPKDFPRGDKETTRELQGVLGGVHFGRRDGLVDVRAGADMTVIVGCGLGGGSLINAAIAIEPDARVFTQGDWPKKLRDPAALKAHYDTARHMLGTRQVPPSHRNPTRVAAMQKAVAAIPGATSAEPATVNITFKKHVNVAGIEQPECIKCGECVTGCYAGSKNTLRMNYLPLAASKGAKIHTGISVLRVERTAAGWEVHTVTDTGTNVLTAKAVILAAGSLGSTEILLRSKLSGSTQLGKHWGANGDLIAFSYNGHDPIRDIGHAGAVPNPGFCGPAMATLLSVKDPDVNREVIIADGDVPSVLGKILPQALALAAPTPSTAAGKAREQASVHNGPYVGAVENTLIMLCIGHDTSAGWLDLALGHVRVNWPGAGDTAENKLNRDRVHKMAGALGGTVVDPGKLVDWLPATAATVHPLGGCRMADDAEHGVVDDVGRVFSASHGTATHRGLYVLDGSIVPRSLGANPLLTITALAERAMPAILAD
jgi:cholesterol oxidase